MHNIIVKYERRIASSRNFENHSLLANTSNDNTHECDMFV